MRRFVQRCSSSSSSSPSVVVAATAATRSLILGGGNKPSSGGAAGTARPTTSPPPPPRTSAPPTPAVARPPLRAPSPPPSKTPSVPAVAGKAGKPNVAQVPTKAPSSAKAASNNNVQPTAGKSLPAGKAPPPPPPAAVEAATTSQETSEASPAPDDGVLLAKAPYALFMLTTERLDETGTQTPLPQRHCALFCPTTNEAIVFTPDTVAAAVTWMVQQFAQQTNVVAGIVFPAVSNSSVLTHVVTALQEQVDAQASNHNSSSNYKKLIVGPDAWSIVHQAFTAQRSIVQNMTVPLGFEHAYTLLGKKLFEPLVQPSKIILADPTGDADALRSMKLLPDQPPSVARQSLVMWDVLLGVHKRFGATAGKKAQSPIDLIIRRAVKGVNIFVVDMESKIGKGSVVDGVTMTVTIFNAQTRTNTVHQLRNLASETVKLNILSTLLYGEGASSIVLLFPSARTKPQQLVAFARTCKPKSPFFVAELSALGSYFGVSASDIHAAIQPVYDPKNAFYRVVATCFPGAPKKDEEINGAQLLRKMTGLGLKLHDERVGSAAVATAFAASRIPAVAASQRDVEAASAEAQAPATTVFVNKVNMRDSDVMFALDDWKNRIYQNTDRLRRETASVESCKRYLVVDLETTTTKRYKRVANPFTKENHIVLSGALDYKGNVFMNNSYFERDESQRYDDPTVCAKVQKVAGKSPLSLFLPPLDDYDIIVGHNLKFDLMHLWRDAELKKFFKRGGRIWDTMYAEYLLTGHQVKLGRGAGLEDVAKSYGGQTPKLDEVKQAWAEGRQTYEIPYPTLREYLMGDLKNTELIFLKHLPRALEQRQAVIVQARMDSLLATTEMEYNGLKTDVAVAIAQSNELVAVTMEKKRELNASIPAEIPSKLLRYFNWASNMHLIAYFFGGKVKMSTGNRESKAITGEKVARHLLLCEESDYPKELYPDGVFLGSLVNASAAGDCAAMTVGGDADKGTRVYVACLDLYMKQAGFRKSSLLSESLSKPLISVSRTDPADISAEQPVANLLPDRYVFLYAAASADQVGSLGSLTLRNAITGEELHASGEDTGKQVETFIRDQMLRHTRQLRPASELADPSMNPTAFIDAQIVLIARDGPFSFTKLVSTCPELRSFLDARVTPSEPGVARPMGEQFCVTVIDASAVYLHHRATYGTQTYAIWTDKYKPTEKDENIVMLPEHLPHHSFRKTKPSSVVPFLKAQAEMDNAAWCKSTSDMFDFIAYRAMLSEGAAPKEPKKQRKNAPPPPADEKLPLLIRRRPYMIEEWKKMEPVLQKKVMLMVMLGRTIGTSFDAFVEATPFDDVVEIPLKGRLSTYVAEHDVDNVINKFRSPVTRQLQVGDESLTYFSKVHKDKIADAISDLRAKEKLIGTYYEHTEGGTGMVSLVHAMDHCIHHELVHNKTNTGRLASSNPNCQNIPKEDKSPLREMFISRFGPTGMCIEADYSQLEVITLAALSNDAQMIEDLKKNVDFHCKRVTMIRPDLKYDDVVLRAKKNKEPDFVKLRQQAKIFSFQRQYGAGVTMLSQSTGLTPDQVRTLIEREREIYRGCDVFTNVVTLSANTYDPLLQDGARNIRGHQFFKGMFPVITGSRYVFTESDVPESIMEGKPDSTKSTNFSPTHLKNYPVQGFAGEIVQIMLGRLWRHFVQNENYGGRALLTNTVHDCVWVDTKKELFREVAADVEKIMSNAKETLNELWPEMQCTVDFPVDVVAGSNMCHLSPISKIPQ